MANYLQNTALSISEDQPQIYVACLASYNNGIRHGIWLDATCDNDTIEAQIKQLLATSTIPGAEAVVIHDYKGFGSLHIEQDESIEEVQEKALFIVEHGVLGAAVLAYHQGNLEYATNTLEEYIGEYESELDYATELFDELYLPEIPEHVRNYITCEYEDFQRDIFIDDYFSLDVSGHCHVFRCY